MTLSFEDTWIKAAVEHRVLNITYVNRETRLVYQKRDVLPDFIQTTAPGGASSGCWALLGHAPQLGIRNFQPSHFQQIRVTEGTFSPPPNSRWQELIPLYRERGLDQKHF